MGFFAGETTLVGSFFRHWEVLGRGLAFMLSFHTVTMAVLSSFAIFLVSERMLNLSFKVEFTIFAAGCIFPTTFSVQAAFQRREQAIEELAKLKSNLTALFQHFIFFDVRGESAAAAEALPLFQRLISHVEIYCRNRKEEQLTTIVNAEGGQRGATSCAHYVWDDFVQISQLLQASGRRHFGHDGSKAVENTGRSWQYVHDAISSFEGVCAIRTSSTPEGLRIFCHFLCNLSCIALAPFWAHFCKEEHVNSQDLDLVGAEQLEVGYGCVSAYLVGVLFAFVVLTLYRVQCELEDPFDGRGDDDIRWHHWREQLDVLGSHGPNGPYLRSTKKLFRAKS